MKSVLKRLTAASFLVGVVVLRLSACVSAGEMLQVRLKHAEDRVTILVGETAVTDYVFHDAKISRPYFAHVKSPNGVRVTRNHPPLAGVDRPDHPEFHPGIWMAFGDLAGCDDWRLKTTVRHAGFIAPDVEGPQRAGFAVRNEYLSADGHETVCEETCRLTFSVRPSGYLLEWDATFRSKTPFWFGDQEEMGLGFRMATPLRVERAATAPMPAGTGEIVDAEGRRNEAQVAKHAARWCDYRGEIDGQRAGIALLCHPQNFRPSWFHARDYGLLVANPFGQKALAGGEPSRVEVKAGEPFRLRYGILIHGGEKDTWPDVEAAYQDYVKLMQESP